jgi:hypothetical protein
MPLLSKAASILTAANCYCQFNCYNLMLLLLMLLDTATATLCCCYLYVLLLPGSNVATWQYCCYLMLLLPLSAAATCKCFYCYLTLLLLPDAAAFLQLLRVPGDQLQYELQLMFNFIIADLKERGKRLILKEWSQEMESD